MVAGTSGLGTDSSVLLEVTFAERAIMSAESLMVHGIPGSSVAAVISCRVRRACDRAKGRSVKVEGGW